MHTPYKDAVTFEELEAEARSLKIESIEAITNHAKNSATNATLDTLSLSNNKPNPETGGFILLFDINDELLFDCFEDQATWKCSFKTFTAKSSKDRLNSILQDPNLISVVFEKNRREALE